MLCHIHCVSTHFWNILIFKTGVRCQMCVLLRLTTQLSSLGKALSKGLWAELCFHMPQKPHAITSRFLLECDLHPVPILGHTEPENTTSKALSFILDTMLTTMLACLVTIMPSYGVAAFDSFSLKRCLLNHCDKGNVYVPVWHLSLLSSCSEVFLFYASGALAHLP